MRNGGTLRYRHERAKNLPLLKKIALPVGPWTTNRPRRRSMHGHNLTNALTIRLRHRSKLLVIRIGQSTRTRHGLKLASRNTLKTSLNRKNGLTLVGRRRRKIALGPSSYWYTCRALSLNTLAMMTKRQRALARRQL